MRRRARQLGGASRAPRLDPLLSSPLSLSHADTLLHCIRACTSTFKPCCVPENKAFWACYKGARGLGDATSLSGVLGGGSKTKKREGGGSDAT